MADFRGVHILILISSATVAQLTVITNTHTHTDHTAFAAKFHIYALSACDAAL